jgi:hypothetical protein
MGYADIQVGGGDTQTIIFSLQQYIRQDGQGIAGIGDAGYGAEGFG